MGWLTAARNPQPRGSSHASAWQRACGRAWEPVRIDVAGNAEGFTIARGKFGAIRAILTRSGATTSRSSPAFAVTMAIERAILGKNLADEEYGSWFEWNDHRSRWIGGHRSSSEKARHGLGFAPRPPADILVDCGASLGV